MSPYESLLVKDESERVSMSHHASGASISQSESTTGNQPIVTLPPPKADRPRSDVLQLVVVVNNDGGRRSGLEVPRVDSGGGICCNRRREVRGWWRRRDPCQPDA